MHLILNIDTALETATVSLANNGEVLESAVNTEQKDHGAWLHSAIETIFKKAGYDLHDLAAVAVSNGPGSYTGLRVALASAKGFCYALNKPLIAVGTLEILAAAVKEKATGLICPLIDARRMEVYAAVYDKDIVEKIPPHVVVLDENSFSEFLNSPVLFCGNAVKKTESLLKHPNASFIELGPTITSFAKLSHDRFVGKKFADIAYTEPLYIKEFYSPYRKD